jgi:hypothetical protein
VLDLDPWAADCLTTANRTTRLGAPGFAAAHIGRTRSHRPPLTTVCILPRGVLSSATLDMGASTPPGVEKRTPVETPDRHRAQQQQALQAGFGDRDAGRCEVACVPHANRQPYSALCISNLPSTGCAQATLRSCVPGDREPHYIAVDIQGWIIALCILCCLATSLARCRNLQGQYPGLST